MSDTTTNSAATPPADPGMARLDALAKLLDNQFRIPGTGFTFGIDGIIGLVPYVGDIAGFLVSGILFRMMLQKGAGPLIMLRMMFNYILDAVVGIVPIAGDLFDFGYKANRRNVDLLKKYYAEGDVKPSAKSSMLILGFVFFLLFAATIWGIWQFAAMVVGWAWTSIQHLW